MNGEKLEKEIDDMHEALNKTLALLRNIAVRAENIQGEENLLECMETAGDMGLSAEMAVDIVQDVYSRLEALPKTLSAA